VSHKRRLHWPPLSASWQSRRRAPHAWAAMGWGRVNPTPPTSINTTRTQKRKKEEKRRKTAEKGGNWERETDCVERETTETEKHKNMGYRLGNWERQTGRRKKKNRRDKPAGKETPTGVSAQWRRSVAAVTGSHCHRHRSATENNHQHHHQLNRPRSPPQVILLFP